MRKNEEHASSSNRWEREVEYPVAQPRDRKRGAINEDPLDGNVRVKVKAGPREGMAEVRTPPGQFCMQPLRKEDRSTKQETQGLAKEDKFTTAPVNQTPAWWQDGVRPAPVKDDGQDGPEEEPLTTADGDLECRWFDDEVAPRSMAEHGQEKERSDAEEDAMSDWFYENVKTGQSEEGNPVKTDRMRVRGQRDVPIPEPLVIDVSDEDSRGEERCVEKENGNQACCTSRYSYT